jgi:hypothetical protein
VVFWFGLLGVGECGGAYCFEGSGELVAELRCDGEWGLCLTGMLVLVLWFVDFLMVVLLRGIIEGGVELKWQMGEEVNVK